tara:strand:- start:960 stop:3476 length:2517 start_codon:yes stop_codon:yes gene_type:complete
MRKNLVCLMMTILLVSSLPLNVSAGPNDDIPTNAQGTTVHDTLVELLTKADLVTTLQGTGPFTVFAPTDTAFANAGIDPANFNTQPEIDALTDILLYHVISGEVPSSAVTDGMLATMVNGDKIKLEVSNGVVTLDGATVTGADVQASNGIIHVIDSVLTPPVDIPATAQTTTIHDSLVAAVIQADLLSTLQGTGPFTVFAPTDQAFSNAGINLADLNTAEGKAILSNILLYHVVSSEVPSSAVTDCMSADAANGQPLSFTVGSGVMVNDANVTIADVVSSNGIIHVIDKVLTPSDTPNDIPRTAQCTGSHNTLVTAVIQAGLLETLQGDGPFTVFAPTDQAFIDAGIDLAAVSQSDLADILTYHVVSGAVPSTAVTECMSANTVNGNPLSFTVSGGVMVNDANVTLADVNTSNGVIHVIDKVLLPTATPNDTPRTAQCTGSHNSLVAAVIQAGLLETLQGDGPFTVFAPTDQAFIDAGIDLATLDTPEGKVALTEILLSHVVSGEVPSSAVTECMPADTVNGKKLSFTVNSNGVMVNDANVTLADVATSNGVIHVIDKVLTPSDTPNDIPRTAQCTGSHNSLVAAVIQAELLTTLQGEGPFTIFAPTDQAFIDAGIDLTTFNTTENKSVLADILLHHVYIGSVMSSNITDGMMVSMANGDNVTISIVNGSVMIGDAKVTMADVLTSNGVIHVIDKVILPPSDEVDDSGDDAESSSEDDSGSLIWIIIGILVVLGGGAGTVLFLRSRNSSTDSSKDFAQGGLLNQLQPVDASSYATQPVQQTQQFQQVQPVQTVEVIPQPVAVEATVVNQWTDENGYTWRSMSDGSTLWWTGTDWQKHG